MVKRVELPVLKKGMHTLSLTVNGEAFGETAFAAVETYKKQPGDEFSRIGINTHIKASEDITTLSRGGAINMRQSMYWNAMEKEKKVYSAADYQYIKNAFEKCRHGVSVRGRVRKSCLLCRYGKYQMEHSAENA